MKLSAWVGLLAFILSLYILWQIRQVILLVFAAVILATALNMLARRLRKSGVKRSLAILLSLGIFMAVLTGFFLIIVPPFVSQYRELTTTKLPQVIDLLNDWRNQLRSYIPPELTQYLPDVASLSDDLSQELPRFANRLLNRSFSFLSSSLLIILNFLLVIILTLMFLTQPLSYRKAFVRLFPSFYRRRVEFILDRCEIALGGWFVGMLISMSVVAFLSICGLWILGVPLALAQGVLAGLLNFIPNIGPTMSVVLPMAIALLEALPAVTLLSQIFFATFLGFLGFLLAIPLTVVGQVWLYEVLVKDVLDRWSSLDFKEDPKPVMAMEVTALEPQVVEEQKSDEEAGEPGSWGDEGDEGAGELGRK